MGVKLNLGSRNRDMHDLGYTNIDCERHPDVDVVADVAVLPFRDGEVDEIYASHILEHFPHTQALTVLKEWRRVLKSGGLLFVAVPDFAEAARLYAERGLNDWLMNFLWGDQGYPTAFHKAGYDFGRLERLLRQAGFSNASQVDLFPHNREDCSNLHVLDNGRKVSLNVIAEA